MVYDSQNVRTNQTDDQLKKITEYEIKKITDLRKRLDICKKLIMSRNDQGEPLYDESLRADGLFVSGELYQELVNEKNNPFRKEISDLIGWMLTNEDNSLVYHDVCYQISARNMREHIPALLKGAKTLTSILKIHEAIENLAMMNADGIEETLQKYLYHSHEDIRITAKYSLLRLKRYKNVEWKAITV